MWHSSLCYVDINDEHALLIVVAVETLEALLPEVDIVSVDDVIEHHPVLGETVVIRHVEEFPLDTSTNILEGVELIQLIGTTILKEILECVPADSAQLWNVHFLQPSSVHHDDIDLESVLVQEDRLHDGLLP